MSPEDVKMEHEERQAKIDMVREQFPDIPFPNPSREPLWSGRKKDDLFRIDGWSITDTITNPQEPVVFAKCVSDIYGLRFHEEVIYAVLETVGEVPEFGTPEYDIVLPKIAEGGKMRMKVRFPEVDYQIREGDVVNPEISVFNSYDLGWKLRGLFGAYRLICSNGLVIGETWAQFAKRHLDSLLVSELVESVRGGMVQFSVQTEQWRKWAELQINENAYANLWEELPFSEKEQEKIKELPEEGTRMLLPDALRQGELTLWNFNSVVTQFVTHEIESDLRRADVESQVADAFHNAYRRAA
jgi:hypothetical protein